MDSRRYIISYHPLLMLTASAPVKGDLGCRLSRAGHPRDDLGPALAANADASRRSAVHRYQRCDGPRRHRQAPRRGPPADPAEPRRRRIHFTPQALQTIPQGENAPLNQVLLQAPGVAQDSFGQIHLRGEHANVQYRLNGVELPEGLSVFGQALKRASPTACR